MSKDNLPRIDNVEWKIGDRVKFKTNGGWYNKGVIEDIDENSCLVKIDWLGFELPSLNAPSHVRLPLWKLMSIKGNDENYCYECPADHHKMTREETTTMKINTPIQPVKIGHWEEQKVGNILLQICDQCGFCYPLIRIGSYFDYCPGCGIKMESEVKE